MIRRVAILLCAAAVIGCSGDSAPNDTRSSAAPASTTTTTTASTTTSTVPLTPAGSPQEAASAFVNAWRAGDRAAALAIALPAAVDAVFNAGEPGAPQNRGCDHPPVDNPVLCVYRTNVGELQVRVRPQPDGWIVDQAIVSPA